MTVSTSTGTINSTCTALTSVDVSQLLEQPKHVFEVLEVEVVDGLASATTSTCLKADVRKGLEEG